VTNRAELDLQAASELVHCPFNMSAVRVGIACSLAAPDKILIARRTRLARQSCQRHNRLLDPALSTGGW
jgi:hypothetical protein